MKFALNLRYGYYFLELEEKHENRLREKFPEVEFLFIEKNDPLFDEKIVEAEAFSTWPFNLESFDRILGKASRLKWVQFSNVGIAPGYLTLARDRKWIVTNARGVASEAISLHAIGFILALERGFHQAFKMQEKKNWEQAPFVRSVSGFEGTNGKLMGIIGLGSIGSLVAKKAGALGMRVWGIRKNAGSSGHLPFVEKVLPPDSLGLLLSEADYVVLALPHLKETDRLIGEKELRAMKKSAYLINVARGSLVDEPALIKALSFEWIAGAALDVAADEPLKSDSPLYSTPNLILTPHIAGLDRRYTDTLTGLIVENLGNYLAGKPLKNLVNLEAGY